MRREKQGRAWAFGDDINTDYIISSRRKRDTLDPVARATFMMEDIRPGFGLQVNPGDFLVGGRNFGCGSAMEIATSVIIGAGVRAVIAKSFARTFFRNGINGGLLLIETDPGSIKDGDVLLLDIGGESTVLHNVTRGEEYYSTGMSQFLESIVESGGLIPYLSKNRGFGSWTKL